MADTAGTGGTETPKPRGRDGQNPNRNPNAPRDGQKPRTGPRDAGRANTETGKPAGGDTGSGSTGG